MQTKNPTTPHGSLSLAPSQEFGFEGDKLNGGALQVKTSPDACVDMWAVLKENQCPGVVVVVVVVVVLIVLGDEHVTHAISGWLLSW